MHNNPLGSMRPMPFLYCFINALIALGFACGALVGIALGIMLSLKSFSWQGVYELSVILFSPKGHYLVFVIVTLVGFFVLLTFSFRSLKEEVSNENG